MDTDLVSFVVRLTRDEADPSAWRGRIVHVQSSAEQYFTRFEDAVAFMQGRLDGGGTTAPEPAARKRARSRPANRRAGRRGGGAA